MFQNLVKEIFLGNIETMRAQFREIPETDRAWLYRDIAPLIKAFRDIFQENDYTNERYRYGSRPKNKSYPLDKLYQDYQQDPAQFLQLKWKDKLQPVDYHNDEPYQQTYDNFLSNGIKMMAFVARLRAIEVGLGDRQTAARGLHRKITDFQPFNIFSYTLQHRIETDPSLLPLGSILLDRETEWRKDLFLELCKNITDWQESYCTGFAGLVMAAGKRFPEWLDELQPCYRAAMRYDGFTTPNWPELFSPEMILAGFDSQEARIPDYLGGIEQIPILNSDVRKSILALFRRNRISRKAILDITFRELLTLHNRPILNNWIKFFQKLPITEQEQHDYRYAFIDLINSNQSEVIQLGLKHLGELWQQQALIATELLPSLCLALQSPIAVTANQALQFIKQVITESNCGIESILIEIIDGLTVTTQK